MGNDQRMILIREGPLKLMGNDQRVIENDHLDKGGVHKNTREKYGLEMINKL